MRTQGILQSHHFLLSSSHSHPIQSNPASQQASQPASKAPGSEPPASKVPCIQASKHPSLQACRIGVYHLPLGAAARLLRPPQGLKPCVPRSMKSTQILEKHCAYRQIRCKSHEKRTTIAKSRNTTLENHSKTCNYRKIQANAVEHLYKNELGSPNGLLDDFG